MNLAIRAAAGPAPALCDFPPARTPRTLPRMNAGADTDDDVLMLAWAAGDAASFELLYARHRGSLYRFLLRQLRDPALADEFFQDVWQRVIAARQGWKPEAAFRTRLFRIAHNRLNDYWRGLKHRPAAPEDADERAARIPDRAARNASCRSSNSAAACSWRSRNCPTSSAKSCCSGWSRN